MPNIKKLLTAAAGTAASGDNLFVEDVFSTYLFEGTGSSLTINNGLDLSGEGGLMWFKGRSGPYQNKWYDTERGIQYAIESDTTDANQTEAQGVTAVGSSGFTLGTDGNTNSNGAEMASWSFRKAEGFFDIVTYTGDSSTSKQISHNLGSTPAMILIKRTDASVNWAVFHKDLPGNNGTGKGYLSLNTNDNNSVNTNCFSTLPTSTQFTVNANYGGTNASGASYVAYLFGDDAVFGEDADEQICKMGSYTADSSNAYFVNLGFEPQWVMIKKTSGDGNWEILDTMRGFGADAANDQILKANSSNAEASDYGAFISSTGFYGSNQSGANGSTYIYMAIRRPMKVPEAGTEVFSLTAFTGNGSAVNISSGFPVDLAIPAKRTNTVYFNFRDRLRGSKETFQLPSTNSEYSNASVECQFDRQDGIRSDGTNLDTQYNANNQTSIIWQFKRASQFMDMVTYTGTASTIQSITHNLTVIPEMIITKSRDATTNWAVYHAGASGGGNPAKDNVTYLNTSDGYGYGYAWANFAPTDTIFKVGNSNDTNKSGDNIIAYLFATLAGISKVGSYTGTGSSQHVTCGFSNGARFVLIKRIDQNGNDWLVFDTARGIVSGNDPSLLFNSTEAEYSGLDQIDPLYSGFTLTSSSTVNASGGTYIFLAIA